MAGQRPAGKKEDRQRDQRAEAEAAGDRAHPLALGILAQDRHYGDAEDELAADEEGHRQQVQVEDALPEVVRAHAAAPPSTSITQPARSGSLGSKPVSFAFGSSSASRPAVMPRCRRADDLLALAHRVAVGAVAEAAGEAALAALEGRFEAERGERVAQALGRVRRRRGGASSRPISRPVRSTSRSRVALAGIARASHFARSA